jgi:hypothetical protein
VTGCVNCNIWWKMSGSPVREHFSPETLWASNPDAKGHRLTAGSFRVPGKGRAACLPAKEGGKDEGEVRR